MNINRGTMFGLAGALAAMSLVGGGMPAIEPRRIEAPQPTMPRDKRKRLARTLSGGHRSRGPFTPLPYVLHALAPNGKSPLCKPAGWALPFGPNRQAIGRAPTCNDCQRAIWRLAQPRLGEVNQGRG